MKPVADGPQEAASVHRLGEGGDSEPGRSSMAWDGPGLGRAAGEDNPGPRLDLLGFPIPDWEVCSQALRGKPFKSKPRREGGVRLLSSKQPIPTQLLAASLTTGTPPGHSRLLFSGFSCFSLSSSSCLGLLFGKKVPEAHVWSKWRR